MEEALFFRSEVAHIKSTLPNLPAYFRLCLHAHLNGKKAKEDSEGLSFRD